MATAHGIPACVTAGDSGEWTFASLDDGWTIHVRLLAFGLSPIEITGNGRTITLDATDTSAWAAGDYNALIWATSGTQRLTLGETVIRIKPNPTGLDETHDPRSENQKILAAINAVLSDELTNPLAEYKIAGREVKRYSREELLRLKVRYQHAVNVEMGRSEFIGQIPIRFAPDFGLPGDPYARG